MNTSIRTVGTTWIINIDGEIDLSSSVSLRRVLFESLQETDRLAVNLAGTTYIDSSGIATVIEVLKEAQRLRKELALFASSAVAQDVFRLTHVTKIFRIFANEAEALKL